MSERFTVSVDALRASAADWADQGSRVATAASRIDDLATEGFAPDGRARIEAWAAEWHRTLRAIADDAGVVRTQLSAAAESYESWDHTARAAFQDWLAGGA